MEKRLEVPDYDDPSLTYLTRWRLICTPWFGVYLHRLGGPDPRETLHDHPWSFLSIVLRGGYIERRLDPITRAMSVNHRIRRVNRVRSFDAHAIAELTRTPTWTLLFVGRRTRTWGYLEKLGEYGIEVDNAWLWTEFDKHPHAAEFAAALDARDRLAK